MDRYLDWVCKPLRPKWQFYLIMVLECVGIAAGIGILGGYLTRLLLL